MAIDYISNLVSSVELCQIFQKSVLDVFFEGGSKEEGNIDNFVYTPLYREFFKPVKACARACDIFGIKPRLITEDLFSRTISDLEIPRVIENKTKFETNAAVITQGFETVKDQLAEICSAFDKEEKERINEAIHNHIEKCNYSCIAMSVSAVESRLLKLMCLANPESESELEKKTLGQLIYEYMSNKESYRNIVSEKHEPLLQLCNTYRTFSVHPKRQRITGRLATSILNLAIEFLTDQDTKPEVVETKLSR